VDWLLGSLPWKATFSCNRHRLPPFPLHTAVHHFRKRLGRTVYFSNA